jgi:hypothetical protein
LIEEEREETTEAKHDNTESTKKEVKLDKKEEKILVEKIDELKTLHLHGKIMNICICINV